MIIEIIVTMIVIIMAVIVIMIVVVMILKEEKLLKFFLEYLPKVKAIFKNLLSVFMSIQIFIIMIILIKYF
jgi:hypothetical protein